MNTAAAFASPRQHAQVARLVKATNRFVRCYRQLWQEANIDVGRLDLPGDWERLPVVQKTDLRRFDLDARLDERFDRGALHRLHTSGSSGHPFEVLIDRASTWRRQWRTMTGLWHCGYRPGQRFVWLERLAGAAPNPRPSLLRRLARASFIDIRLDPKVMAEQYCASRPDLVYGQFSALVMLSETLQPSARPRLSLAVGFGEQLTPGIRKLIETRLGAQLAEIYGNTEVGLIAARRPDDASYRTIGADLLLEYLPSDGTPGFERLIVTNLRGGAMPFVRYDTGDLVRRDHSRPERPIVAMAGSQFDFLTMRDGRRIAPYLIDMALDDLPGVRRFRVVQQADYSVNLHLVTANRPAADVIRDASAEMLRLCGPTLELRVIEPSEGPDSAVDKLRFIQSLIRPAAPPA